MDQSLGAHVSWSVFVSSDGISIALDGGDDVEVGRLAAQNKAKSSDANGMGEGDAPGIAAVLQRFAGSRGQQ